MREPLGGGEEQLGGERQGGSEAGEQHLEAWDDEEEQDGDDPEQQDRQDDRVDQGVADQLAGSLLLLSQRAQAVSVLALWV